MGMTNIKNAESKSDIGNGDFIETVKTPVKIQMWTTDGNVVKGDILGEFVKELDADAISRYIVGQEPVMVNSLDNKVVISMDGSISEEKMFLATFNVTTYAALKEAYDAGLPCFAIHDESVYVMSQVEPGLFRFSNIRGTDDLIRTLTVDENDRWKVSSNKVFQQKLVAGDNITIKDNTISAKGGDAWVEDGGDLSEIDDNPITMYEYRDSTYTGYKQNVTIAANDVEHSMLKLFNDGTDAMNVTVLTGKTLFGAGNRITGGYGYTVKAGCALFLRVNGKCLIASYSNGNPGSDTQEQPYTVGGNPNDSLTFSTSFSNAFKAGVERLGDTIGSLTTTFSNAIRNGVEKLNDSLGTLETTFSNNIILENE